MPEPRNPWHPFGHGETIGQAGSEGGATLRDDEHDGGARITLERGTQVAPFAVTCGMYGWFFHTVYFSEEPEAEWMFREMKGDLERMIALVGEIDSDPEHGESKVLAAISDFVERFP